MSSTFCLFASGFNLACSITRDKWPATRSGGAMDPPGTSKKLLDTFGIPCSFLSIELRNVFMSIAFSLKPKPIARSHSAPHPYWVQITCLKTAPRRSYLLMSAKEKPLGAFCLLNVDPSSFCIFVKTSAFRMHSFETSTSARCPAVPSASRTAT